MSGRRGSLIRDAVRRLTEAGVSSPRADADIILAHVLDIDRGRLILVDEVNDQAVADFNELIARRAESVPVQHVIGTADFAGITVAVGPGVFIPRPETESLYSWAATYMRDVVDPRVVDLCSGSGALALALASAYPRAHITAVELDPDALMWLRRNVAAHRGTVHVVAADATDPALPGVLGLSGTVDLVVSNPPYIPSGSTLPRDVVDGDPHPALFGGPDGMSVIVPMAAVISAFLRDGGVCAIEHDDTTAGRVCDVLAESAMFDDIRSHTDLAGRPRFVTATRVCRRRS